MPFPWTKCSNQCPSPFNGAEQAAAVSSGQLNRQPKRPRICRSSGRDEAELPWFSELAEPCQHLKCITFNVPKLGISAGSVVQHSRRVISSIFSKQDPCIFKIGFTHDPAWRWGNSLYGYQKAKDGWTNMVVMYIANEPYSPAMLEAALINVHGGFSIKFHFIFLFQPKIYNLFFFSVGIVFSMYWELQFVLISPWCPGRPGCRNIKLGGDNAIPPSEASGGWYATYVVYRSFKHPPPIPKIRELGG